MPCVAWSTADSAVERSVPGLVSGSDDQIERAYFDAYRMLDRRIALFISLPLVTLEREVVQREIDKVGRS